MIVRSKQPAASDRTGRKGMRVPGNLHKDYQALVRRIGACGDGASRAARAIAVTSGSRRAGASTVAANLAVAEAQAWPDPTLLIDANLERPSLARRFRVQRSPGLREALGGETDPAECLQSSPLSNLRLMTAGVAKGRAEGGDHLSALEGLLRVFKRDFRTVFVDLPPVAENGAWCPLIGALDGVILVIEAERTDGRSALYAKQRLLESNANILGVVFNKRRMHIPGWLYRIL